MDIFKETPKQARYCTFSVYRGLINIGYSKKDAIEHLSITEQELHNILVEFDGKPSSAGS